MIGSADDRIIGSSNDSIGDKFAADQEAAATVVGAARHFCATRQALGAEADSEAIDAADLEREVNLEADAESRDVDDHDLAGPRVVVVAEEHPAAGLARQPAS